MLFFSSSDVFIYFKIRCNNLIEIGQFEVKPRKVLLIKRALNNYDMIMGGSLARMTVVTRVW